MLDPDSNALTGEVLWGRSVRADVQGKVRLIVHTKKSDIVMDDVIDQDAASWAEEINRLALQLSNANSRNSTPIKA